MGCERCDNDLADGIVQSAYRTDCWRCGWELGRPYSHLVEAAEMYGVGGNCISCGCTQRPFTQCVWCGGEVVDEVAYENHMYNDYGSPQFASPVRSSPVQAEPPPWLGRSSTSPRTCEAGISADALRAPTPRRGRRGGCVTPAHRRVCGDWVVPSEACCAAPPLWGGSVLARA